MQAILPPETGDRRAGLAATHWTTSQFAYRKQHHRDDQMTPLPELPRLPLRRAMRAVPSGVSNLQDCKVFA